MADPVIPATDTVSYYFSFPSAGAAGSDPIVGEYSGQEVLIYTQEDSTSPMAGFQSLVNQPGPINDALYDHPNLLFAICMQLYPASTILKSVFSAEQMAALIVILSNYGTITPAGFY